METSKTLKFTISTCRLCRYYRPVGRRGGLCCQLNVPVQSNWKACSLAISPFSTSWESIEAIWQSEQFMVEETVSKKYSSSSSLEDPHQQVRLNKCSLNPEKLDAQPLLV